MSQIDLFSQTSNNDLLLKKRKRLSMPEFMSPMLATLTKDYFSNKY
jgi:hypothetical protein